MHGPRFLRWRFVVALLATAGTPAVAQDWLVGVKAGAGHGGFTGGSEFTWTETVPASSLFLSRAVAAPFWFNPELALSHKSGISSVSGTTLTMMASYVELPALLQVKLPGVGPLRPFVAGGPSLSFRTTCSLQFVGGGISTSDSCDVIRGEQSARFDFGIVGAAGLELATRRFTLSVEARATTGLRSSVVLIDAANSHSYGWAVLAGAAIPLRFRPATRVPASLPPAQRPVAVAPLPEPVFVPDVITRPSAPQMIPTEAGVGAARVVNVNAVNADAKSLLIAIAREGGVPVVVSEDVQARVSVSLSGVPAMEAIQAIADLAGLTITQPRSATMPAVVFYHLPINVNRATAPTISARFGVSAEMANFIVESRPAPAPRAP